MTDDSDEFDLDMSPDCTYPDGLGKACASWRERSAIGADVVTALSSAWLRYAVPAALRGEMPRTQVYVVPTLSGSVVIDLGRGLLRRPMVFGGLAHADAECDEMSLTPPEPAQQVEEVLMDEMFELRWPAFRTAGGTA